MNYVSLIFVTPKVIDTLVKETNRYAKLYLNLHMEDLKSNSDCLAWPKDGIDRYKMHLFLADIFLGDIVKFSRDFMSVFFFVLFLCKSPLTRL